MFHLFFQNLLLAPFKKIAGKIDAALPFAEMLKIL